MGPRATSSENKKHLSTHDAYRRTAEESTSVLLTNWNSKPKIFAKYAKPSILLCVERIRVSAGHEKEGLNAGGEEELVQLKVSAGRGSMCLSWS